MNKSLCVAAVLVLLVVSVGLLLGLFGSIGANAAPTAAKVAPKRADGAIVDPDGAVRVDDKEDHLRIHRAIWAGKGSMTTGRKADDQARHPQPNVLSGPEREAIGLVIYLTPEAWTQSDLARSVARGAGAFHRMVAAINYQLAQQNATGDQHPLVAGLGFSPAAWQRWGGAHWGTPAGMAPFAGYEGPEGWPVMPATAGDLFIHAKCGRRDALYGLANSFVELLGGSSVVETTDATMAWRNGLDGSNRDLTGYVDGTNNCPSTNTVGMGLISADQDPVHVNGSFAIAQRWLHDLAAFGRLNATAQDAVFGRTKRDSQPIPHPPPDSHLVRVRQKEFGYFIVRQAIPWGDTSRRAGLFFIAYASDARRLELMCRSMVGQGTPFTPAGPYDAVMRFSVPETGNFWYFPSMELLQSLGEKDFFYQIGAWRPTAKGARTPIKIVAHVEPPAGDRRRPR